MNSYWISFGMRRNVGCPAFQNCRWSNFLYSLARFYKIDPYNQKTNN